MPARLTLFPPDLPARVVLLEEGSEYVLGREPGCDVRVQDERISRRHAALSFAEGRWTLADLGSKNGVLVDGVAVRDAAVILEKRSWLSLGGVPGRFEELSETVGRRAREDELERWQTSLELQRRLSPTRGLDTLLGQVLDSVLQLTGAERGFVLLARPEGDLEIRATSGVDREEIAAPEFRGSAGAVERVLASGSPMAVSDAQGDAWLGGRPSVVGGGIRAMVCVPLMALGRKIGAIYADSRAAGKTFTELDVSILEALSTHAALAIAVARLDSELKGLVDSLRDSPESQVAERIETAWKRSLTAYETNGESRPPAAAASPTIDSDAPTWTGLIAIHRRLLGERR